MCTMVAAGAGLLLLLVLCCCHAEAVRIQQSAAEIAAKLRNQTSLGSPDVLEYAADELLRRDLHDQALLEILHHGGWQGSSWLRQSIIPPGADIGTGLGLLAWLRRAVQPKSLEQPKSDTRGPRGRQEPDRRLQMSREREDEEDAAASVAGQPLHLRYEKLRSWLLDGYNVATRADNFNQPSSNIDVRVHIDFLKVTDLDVKTSSLELPVWLKVQWKDDRLRFNKTLWGFESMPFQVDSSNMMNTRIWLPDVELYNARKGLATTLIKKAALVSPDGSVYWQRPGHFLVLCKFEGLINFPTDSLTCDLEFGSWSLDSNVHDLTFHEDGGFTSPVSGSSRVSSHVAGSTFQAFSIEHVSGRRFVASYDCCPGEFPILLYTVKMKRSSLYYVMKLIMPQLAMAALSLITYFMQADTGERLTFGITLVLAVVTTDIVATELMPVCEEALLMNWISWLSLFFCVLSLFESAVVLFLFYLEVIDIQQLLPRSLQFSCLKSNDATLEQMMNDLRTAVVTTEGMAVSFGTALAARAGDMVDSLGLEDASRHLRASVVQASALAGTSLQQAGESIQHAVEESAGAVHFLLRRLSCSMASLPSDGALEVLPEEERRQAGVEELVGSIFTDLTDRSGRRVTPPSILSPHSMHGSSSSSSRFIVNTPTSTKFSSTRSALDFYSPRPEEHAGEQPTIARSTSSQRTMGAAASLRSRRADGGMVSPVMDYYGTSSLQSVEPPCSPLAEQQPMASTRSLSGRSGMKSTKSMKSNKSAMSKSGMTFHFGGGDHHIMAPDPMSFAPEVSSVSHRGRHRAATNWSESRATRANTGFGEDDDLLDPFDLIAPDETGMDSEEIEKLRKAQQRRRMQLYREAFYILDDDLSGFLERDEIDYFGRFMCGNDWSIDLLAEFMAVADKDSSGGLSMEEFTIFCEYCISDQDALNHSIPYIAEMIKGFISMTKTRRAAIVQKWQRRAAAVDDFFKWTVPLVMGIAFSVLLARPAEQLGEAAMDKATGGR
eukprot:TRINITY_DN50681_c0_g3_i1.p1 TRINITY_DN50681_c0_g3~~TRINITY_DN50681_c0_g3_i1.p1  ORF type:complete len:1004 (+),score=219.76 TRINITY_DN50681_c0_g3_i1:165-3176(+)